jgi:hypothetical protein
MAQRINAFLAPLVAAYGPRPPVALVPALRDAQEEALQEADSKRRKEDLAVEEGVNEVLAWAKTHRPKNTSRAYQPKQKEWKVSFPAPFSSFLFIPFILLYSSTTNLVYIQAWCETMDFQPGGEYLPFDWVDEGKLLLFVKTQVAERAPRKGRRVAAEKKRKLEEEAEAEASKKKRRRRGQEAGTMAEAVEAPEEAPDGGDEEPKSELQLMYNSVRGYVSAIMELWNHQVSRKLHSSPSPHNVAVKALKTSVARGQHQRRRAEFEDRGLSTIMDRYTAKQIPDMTRVVWRNALGPRTSEQSFWTNLDFLLGNTMLLRQSNRLPLELPDLFSLDLPKEGQQGKGWCLVAAMDQGKYHTFLSLLPCSFYISLNSLY